VQNSEYDAHEIFLAGQFDDLCFRHGHFGNQDCLGRISETH